MFFFSFAGMKIVQKEEHLKSNFNQHKRPKNGQFLLMFDLNL